jgi:MFS family permease
MASNAADSGTRAATTEFQVTETYRYYVVWLLCIVYTFNHVDRQILAILIEPIKLEFGFSDTQMGVLGGLAFAIFYSTLGIPIARWADRSNRVTIIAASLAVWSLFTVVTGMARNFWQLLCARVIVGVGEAGCSPPAYSIIADYFEPKRRSTAFAIYALGVSGGGILGLLVGGALAETYGWRSAFYVLGPPGILLAVILKLTLREPPRGFSDPSASREVPPPALQVFKLLWSKVSFRNLSSAAALHALAAYGVGGFYSAFLIRSHDMDVAEAGRWLAFATIGGGLAGTYLGGKLSDFFAARYGDVRWQMWVPASALLINLPVGVALFLVPEKHVAIGLLTLNIAFGSSYLAPTIATTQRLVGLRERALSTAILFLVLNLIGLGLGPVATGFLSDTYAEYFASQRADDTEASGDGLRFALMTMLFTNVLSIICYLRTTRSLRAELAS